VTGVDERLHRLLVRKVVTDPQGRRWTVGIRWLPRPPRWLGWRRKRRRAERAEGPSWSDLLDVPDIAAADDIRVMLVIVALVLLAFSVWFFVLPVAILLLDLLFVLVLAGLAVFARVAFRRPWVVEARTAGETREWAVVGWRASRHKVDEVATQIQLGD
jgi:hypothetical protein